MFVSYQKSLKERKKEEQAAKQSAACPHVKGYFHQQMPMKKAAYTQ